MLSIYIRVQVQVNVVNDNGYLQSPNIEILIGHQTLKMENVLGNMSLSSASAALRGWLPTFGVPWKDAGGKRSLNDSHDGDLNTIETVIANLDHVSDSDSDSDLIQDAGADQIHINDSIDGTQQEIVNASSDMANIDEDLAPNTLEDGMLDCESDIPASQDNHLIDRSAIQTPRNKTAGKTGVNHWKRFAAYIQCDEDIYKVPLINGSNASTLLGKFGDYLIKACPNIKKHGGQTGPLLKKLFTTDY